MLDSASRQRRAGHIFGRQHAETSWSGGENRAGVEMRRMQTDKRVAIKAFCHVEISHVRAVLAAGAARTKPPRCKTPE